MHEEEQRLSRIVFTSHAGSLLPRLSSAETPTTRTTSLTSTQTSESIKRSFSPLSNLDGLRSNNQGSMKRELSPDPDFKVIYHRKGSVKREPSPGPDLEVVSFPPAKKLCVDLTEDHENPDSLFVPRPRSGAQSGGKRTTRPSGRSASS